VTKAWFLTTTVIYSGKEKPLSKTKRRSSGRDLSTISIDLYEVGDRMMSLPSHRISGQTETRSASIPNWRLRQLNRKSGWEKPTIQLAMLIGLERDGNLTIGGKRRLHKMLASQSTQVQQAAISRSHISLNPSFWTLKEWVNRPCSLPSFKKKPKLRIGIGYRDKGSLPPYYSRVRTKLQTEAIYLGEKMEYVWDLQPEVALLVQDYGYLLNHLHDGWWEPDHRLRYLMVVRRLLD